ncbi:response regulator [Patescibacteria group bacterium AH-259-L07]|nr:response regulator [Patescibacteria group bacterium AH-259-L07]
MSNGQQKKILIAEDDPSMSDILVKMMKSTNYKVIRAKDGQKAIDLAIKERPDLILLDILMPKLSGFEVLEKLRYHPAIQNIPVIILSILGQEKDIVRGKELGAAEYLVKTNIHLSEILDKIDKYIGGKTK